MDDTNKGGMDNDMDDDTGNTIELIATKGCNIYLLKHEGNWLVDAGTPGVLKRLAASGRLKNLKNLKIDGIILTHAHFDHIGGSYELQKHFDCPVYVHKLDLPYVTGEEELSFGGVLGRAAKLLELFSRSKVPEDVRDVSETPLEVLHFPGHTPGSIGIVLGRALVCGDLVRKGRRGLILGDEVPKLSPPTFCSDYSGYLNSVKKAAEMEFDVLLPGHGGEISRGEFLNVVSRIP
jgi:glyoxylase-like metal-dependent hydrolase (beta-lactamase superfamily II)